MEQQTSNDDAAPRDCCFKIKITIEIIGTIGIIVALVLPGVHYVQEKRREMQFVREAFGGAPFPDILPVPFMPQHNKSGVNWLKNSSFPYGNPVLLSELPYSETFSTASWDDWYNVSERKEVVTICGRHYVDLVSYIAWLERNPDPQKDCCQVCMDVGTYDSRMKHYVIET
eukprot:896996_1